MIKFLVLSLALLISACDPLNTEFSKIEDAKLYTSKIISPAPTSPSAIHAMTWNIKFGGGRIDFFFECHGDRVLMKKSEVIKNLQALANAINIINPDIILLQEIDVLSKRSAYVNQIQWLLDNTELNYGAYASQWKADFVPSDGVGKVDSGNAILSRWPLANAKRYALDKISDQDALTKYFYLKRNYIKATISPKAGTTIHLLNIHTSAFSQDGTKKKQLDSYLNTLNELNSANEIFIAGGDFNTIPPGSIKTQDFPDSICTDGDFQADNFSAETNWLDVFYSTFTPAISLADYSNDNSPYFTHTTDKNGFWNRKLDYLFTNVSYEANSAIVYQDSSNGGIATMPLSDHAPIAAKVVLP